MKYPTVVEEDDLLIKADSIKAKATWQIKQQKTLAIRVSLCILHSQYFETDKNIASFVLG